MHDDDNGNADADEVHMIVSETKSSPRNGAFDRVGTICLLVSFDSSKCHQTQNR